MVLGLMTGSMPMLFSLMLMQGITLTMWRSFLDRAIPRFNGYDWRKNIEQTMVPPIVNQPVPNSVEPTMADPSNANVANSNNQNPILNSLSLLSNLDPNVINLLSQIKSNRTNPNAEPQVPTPTDPHASIQLPYMSQPGINPSIASYPNFQHSPGMLENDDPNSMDQGQQLSDMEPYGENNEENVDQSPIRYIEMSSTNPRQPSQQPDINYNEDQQQPQQQQYVYQYQQEYQQVDPQEQDVQVNSNGGYYESEPPDESEVEQPRQQQPDEQAQVQYEYLQEPDSLATQSPQVEYIRQVEYQPISSDQREVVSELNRIVKFPRKKVKKKGRKKMPPMIIGPPIPNTSTFPKRRNKKRPKKKYDQGWKFTLPKAFKRRKNRRMFGKPRILTKRMLTVANQAPLNDIPFRPILLNSTMRSNPRWWNVRNDEHRKPFHIAAIPPLIYSTNVIVPSQMLQSAPSEIVQNKTPEPRSLTKTTRIIEPVAVAMENQTKKLKLKSNKIQLVDIDEVKSPNENCNRTSNNKFSLLWSAKTGWPLGDKCYNDTGKIKHVNANIIQIKMDGDSNSTQFKDITTEKPINKTSTITETSTETSSPTTSTSTASTVTSTIDQRIITTTPISTSTTTISPNLKSFIFNFNQMLSSFTSTTEPTSTRLPTSYTTSSSIIQNEFNADELPKEFMILIAINASKIDDYQMRNNMKPKQSKPFVNEIGKFDESKIATDDKNKNKINPTNEIEEEEDNDYDYDYDQDDEEDVDDQIDWNDEIDSENRVDGKNPANHRFKRICYYLLNGGKGAQLNIAKLELHICSHLIVAYARISPNGLVVAERPFEDSEKYRQLTLMKLKYPSLKVLLSVGDFGGTSYSIVASANRTRERFIESILDYCDEFGFDGVGIDWEFPSIQSGYNQDRINFILLLNELRSRSDQVWKVKRRRRNHVTKVFSGGSKFIISVAVGAPLIIASTSYMIPSIAKVVDFCCLMSYDFHYYRSDRPYTGHHSPLYPRSTDQAYFSTLNVAWAATFWANKGMPLEKIIVGVPTYARTYNLVVPIGQNVLNAPASGPGLGHGKINYSDVCRFLKLPGSMKQFDVSSQVPYAYRNYDWISYENEMSVAIKAQWVIKTGMGGIVTFALNFDDHSGTCRDDGKKFPLQKTISNLLELASIRSYKKSSFVMKIRD